MLLTSRDGGAARALSATRPSVFAEPVCGSRQKNTGPAIRRPQLQGDRKREKERVTDEQLRRRGRRGRARDAYDEHVSRQC
ncbi:hypothetical protein SDJN03_17344, partial [Cucurbita argyrosperma subsp. sororia]